MSRVNTPTNPLILRGASRPIAVSEPLPGTHYDQRRQLWITIDGTPVVLQSRSSSDFGETTVTTSQEGVDCSERLASDFGETTVTKTAEGTDMTETFLGSDFGETTKSATVEGTDQVEATDLKFSASFVPTSS